MMYWQIGMILLVSVAFYLSQLFGFEYRQGLFAAAIAATAATCGAIAAVAAELPDPSSDPFVLRRARHAVSGVIAAAAPAAVAWFLMVPRAGFISFAIASVFAVLAVWMAVEVVQGSTEEHGAFPYRRFFCALAGMVAETGIVFAVLMPHA
jgi:hypothetical protein